MGNLALFSNAVKRDVTVTNRHEAFAGSEFKDFEFAVDVQIPTASEQKKIESKFYRNGRNILDNEASAEVMEAKFQAAVVGWRGIDSQDGSPVPCDSEMKAWLWEHRQDFCGRILRAMTIERERIEAGVAAGAKN